MWVYRKAKTSGPGQVAEKVSLQPKLFWKIVLKRLLVTTPICFIIVYPFFCVLTDNERPFHTLENKEWVGKSHAFGYWADDSRGFVLHSPGPDGLVDMPDFKQCLSLTRPGYKVLYQYDPTNGSISRGDIIRTYLSAEEEKTGN